MYVCSSADSQWDRTDRYQWNGAVKLLPLWLAPNMVTLLGFGFIMGNVLLLQLYIPDLVGPVRHFHLATGMSWSSRDLHGYITVLQEACGCKSVVLHLTMCLRLTGILRWIISMVNRLVVLVPQVRLVNCLSRYLSCCISICWCLQPWYRFTELHSRKSARNSSCGFRFYENRRIHCHDSMFANVFFNLGNISHTYSLSRSLQWSNRRSHHCM